MSNSFDTSMTAKAARDHSWSEAERIQAEEFKRLSLREKWQAITAGSELLVLIERAAANRRAAEKGQKGK